MFTPALASQPRTTGVLMPSATLKSLFGKVNNHLVYHLIFQVFKTDTLTCTRAHMHVHAVIYYIMIHLYQHISTDKIH